ncbi:GlsB/YeaQ/YmgE family stress response membrane protein [Mesorhizobium sp. STM 4661]|uniref:GlsB/YeaQ/YmgE family stress response membrane protein n=1 Tax=Mesorhizobium sp. STM 4661 TaxID=1297570 RepID=UPI0002BF6E81|nr:GlsB/YeaQ/YmgE family stress response membrane protein [Mesorhizobium sp. STM 4661]CCV13615.1 Transglycosylase-associated protein [Mesorhizobium sp. STM 4661]
MDVNGVGWIAAIIIGGLAGWFAEMFMKSNTGILMNIILGIVGAVVLNAILQALNIGSFGAGWIAYLITGFIGACLLIWVGRLVRR